MKKNKASFVAKIFVILSFVCAIFVGGFFFLDKIIVPRYFGSYGIFDVGDLIGVVSSLYSTPKESEIVTNGFSQNDLSNAIAKLQTSGYKIEDDGTILDENIEKFKGDGQVKLTDREVAAVCNKLIENGMLTSALPDLNYLNVINISVLELIIDPDEESLNSDDSTYTKAKISFIAKIETKDLRTQISEQMQTPMYLLKIIIPDTLYFSVNYEVDLEAAENNKTSGNISINGKTAKQSETLINLLIEFIFPEEDKMDINGFTMALGDVAMKGIDALGDFKFFSGIGSTSGNGIIAN